MLILTRLWSCSQRATDTLVSLLEAALSSGDAADNTAVSPAVLKWRHVLVRTPAAVAMLLDDDSVASRTSGAGASTLRRLIDATYATMISDGLDSEAGTTFMYVPPRRHARARPSCVRG